MTLRHVGRLLPLPLAFVLSVACADKPTSPAITSKDNPAATVNRVVQRTLVRTLRDELRDVAGRAPGFTGVSVDDGGGLVISARTPTLTATLLSEVRRWLAANGRPDLATRTATLRRVSSDYSELYGFYQSVGPRVVGLPGVSGFGIDEVSGHVIVQVDGPQFAARARSEIATLALPVDAAVVEVVQPAPDLQGLQGAHATMRGGIQTSRHPFVPPSGGGECTIGFVGWFTDTLQPSQPDFNRRVMTTASHCTSDQRNVNGDTFGQPYVTTPVATEIDEAPYWSQPDCPQTFYPWCRYADVAVLQIESNIASASGTVAISSPTTAPNNPPYLGARAYVGSGVIGVVTNEHVMKVGRTTGQTGLGRVDQSCVDRQSSNLPGMWTLCAQHALVTAGPGDSGAPVFIPLGSSYPPNPRPAGVLFQGNTNSTWFSPAIQVLTTLGNKYFIAW